MKVSELKTEMDGRFERVDGELSELRQLIKTEGEVTRRYLDQEVRQLVKSEGEATRQYFDQEGRQLLKAEGEATRQYFDQEGRQLLKAEGEATRQYFDQEFRQLVKAESETTRRHFDVVAEKMASERNLALDRSLATAQQLVDFTASNARDHVGFEGRLDDHARRLDSVEARDADPKGRADVP